MISDLFNTIRAHFFSISVLIVLLIGWSQRDDNYLSAETGAGYILGIVGGSLMLVLLLYPLSKRTAALTRFIPIRYWFGIHMFLGTVGPVLILFHSNFHMGSTNSSIALWTLLLVAGSGGIGKYVYTKIHHGLYGTQMTLKELKLNTDNDHTELMKLYAMDEKLNARLRKMEEKALKPYTSLLRSIFHVMYMAIKAPSIKRNILRVLKDSSQENQEMSQMPDSATVKKLVSHYMLALRQAAAFRVYERVFSLWHILHLPLFFMMLITAIIHIFAVHMY
jgi:hypothetical protein